MKHKESKRDPLNIETKIGWSSPVPWSVSNQFDYEILDAKGKMIVQTEMTNYGYYPEYGKANAELIVTAVNSFEADRELIERLKTANDYLIKSLNYNSQATLEKLQESDKDRELIKELKTALEQTKKGIDEVFKTQTASQIGCWTELELSEPLIDNALTHAKTRGF